MAYAVDRKLNFALFLFESKFQQSNLKNSFYFEKLLKKNIIKFLEFA